MSKFAPVLISCEEIGELSERPFCVAEPAPIEKSARLHVANETMEAITGTVSVSVPALDGLWLDKLDFSGCNEQTMFIISPIKQVSPKSITKPAGFRHAGFSFYFLTITAL